MTQAHGLPTLPTPRTQAETRFIALMAELFQLDEAQSLDFGLYRVIRRQNREVRGFLGEFGPGPNGPALHGGRLCQLLDDAFAAAGHEAQAQEEDRLKGLGLDLGLTPGMTRQQRDAALDQLALTPLLKPQVAQYRALAEARAGNQTGESDRAEVLNRLYQFFSRHYQDGDFIVERRYGKGGARYLRSTGEDTEFHWATQDMYYIKSGDSFSVFPVRLGNGRRLCFTVEPAGLRATRATLKPSDKAHYALAAITAQGEVIRVVLHYRKGAQNEKQKEEIVAAILAAGAGGGATTSTEIRRWLNRFIARNQSDFFIHKRLGEALAEDLDLFIKTEVLDLDQLLADAAAPSLPGRALKVGRILRTVGAQIIAFLAALENFQKALWEKKKLVLSTRYVITLDRLDRHAPAWLAGHIDAIVAGQRAEWTELGLGDYPDADACRRTTPGDLLTATATRYLPLPVDTGRFPDAFKWSLLEAVTATTPLDQALDGLAIHSDNWQALNLLREKYRERVKCIYIDPPYNTGGDGFPYKDSYPHASRLAMMDDRVVLGREMMNRAGAMFASIDYTERTGLAEIFTRTFGIKNRVEEIIWSQTIGSKNQSPTYSTNHEYVLVYAKDIEVAKADENMFREPKPGAAELLEFAATINPEFPSIARIESAIELLFKKHREELRAQLEDEGIEYHKGLDPWSNLYNYRQVEYRTAEGRYVPESEARKRDAKIWIWMTDPSSMPQVKADSQRAEFKDPKSPLYRFYRPIHPVSRLPCPAPKRGWVWPEKPVEGLGGSFQDLDLDQRISWADWNPQKPQTPRVKKFLHEMDRNVAKSVVVDNTSGERELTNLTGTTRTFPNPKPTSLIARFISQTTDVGDWTMDFFAGSGTTYQACVTAGRDARERRPVILIEAGSQFEDIMIPRVKRVAAATDWRNGRPLAVNGGGCFLRLQRIEQYEDSLESLDTDLFEGDTADLPFDDPALALRYRLDRASRGLYCAIERFGSPFRYQLRWADGGGAAQPCEVDLVESLAYLLGLDIARIYREPLGVVLLGSNRRGQTVGVFFRECAAAGSADWVAAKLAQHPAERVYTNDPAALSFHGCERLEAIEAAFALQFGRA